jgi:hypothetical protein
LQGRNGPVDPVSLHDKFRKNCFGVHWWHYGTTERAGHPKATGSNSSICFDAESDSWVKTHIPKGANGIRILSM